MRREIFVIDSRDPLILYLLDDISEYERQEIEEQLLTDVDFIAELNNAEIGLIKAYITGTLSGTNKKLFETNYLCTIQHSEKYKLLEKYESSERSKHKEVSLPTFRFKSLITPKILSCAVLACLSIVSIWVWDLYTIKRSEWALIEAYTQERPIEARISGFSYAKFSYKRGNQPIQYNKQKLSKAQFLIATQINDSTSLQTLKMLGRVKLAQKDFDYAIESFEEVLRGEDDARTHNDIGAAYIAKERTNQTGFTTGESLAIASEHLQKAVDLDPNLLEAYFNLALCRQYQMLWRTSAETWKEYLLRDSQSQWADEAKKNLQRIEDGIKQAGQNRDQMFNKFLEAVKVKDAENAWQVYADSRPGVGSFILTKIIDRHLIARAKNNTLDAETALQSLVFIGQVERKTTGDQFTLSIAQDYQVTPVSQIRKLIEARELYKLTIELLKQSQFEGAILSCEKAISIFNKNSHNAEALLAQSILGYLYFRRGETKQSLPILIAGSEESKNKSYKWLWGTYQNALYNINVNLTEYAKAHEYNKNYIDGARQIDDSAGLLQGLMAASELNIRLGKYNDGLLAVNEGLSLADSTKSPLRNYVGLYMYGSWHYQELGYLSAAYDYQMEGIKASLEAKNAWIISIHYINLAHILSRQHKYNEAIGSLLKAIEFCKQIQDSKLSQETLATVHLYLGKVYREAENISRSNEHLDKAQQIMKESSFENVYLLFEIDKGRLQTAIKSRDYASAETYLGKVLEHYEAHRSKIEEEMSRNIFFHKEQNIYDLAIEFSYFQMQDIERTFEYSELNRARSLYDLVNIPGRKFLENQIPSIQIPYTIKPLSFKQIQERIPDNTVLLQYALTDNHLIVWVLTNAGIKSRSTDITEKNLDTKITQYLSELEANSLSSQNIDYKQQARELYDILIKPIEEELHKDYEVCVIPDKSLGRLPFASLISSSTGRYLIEDRVIYMSSSTNMFISATERALQKKLVDEERILAIGPATFNDLPYAESQAKDVRALYKFGVVMVGKDSKKAQIRVQLQQSDIVDFAMHYITDEISPLLSYFPLADDDDVSYSNIRDGKLAAYELYNMNLSRLRIAVLSACQTGLETYYNSEGPIGLSRIFQSVGVPLVIASLWRVEDYPIRTLMVAFHKHRKTNHLSTAKALRAAQLDMIKSNDPRLNIPFHWAAFSLYGGHTTF